MDKIRKKIISFFKSIDFKIEITTNLTEFNLFDATYNLEKILTDRTKKPKDNLTYIKTSSNHPP